MGLRLSWLVFVGCLPVAEVFECSKAGVPRARRVLKRLIRPGFPDLAVTSPTLRVALAVTAGLHLLQKTPFGAGNACTLSFMKAMAGLCAHWEFKERFPIYRVQRAIGDVYEPPYEGPWEGSASVEKAVHDFLGADPSGKILLVEDSKRTLVDNALRGRTRVLKPCLRTMMLEENLSKTLGINESLGGIAYMLNAAMEANPQPVKIILDVPLEKATDIDLLNLLTDADELKTIAGDIVTIVATVPRLPVFCGEELPSSLLVVGSSPRVEQRVRTI